VPIEIAPNRIELSALTGGYAPDPEEAGLDLASSPDMLNLLPDPGSGTPETRKGFARLSSEARINSSTSAHWIRHLNYYEYIASNTRHRKLVAVLSNGTDNSADNIQIWVYDLDADTCARVDTPGRTWTKANREHWYAVIQGVYYGGTGREAMYSYDGTTWDATPSTGNWKTWVNGTNASIDTDTQYGKDFAFKKNTKVAYSGDYYSAARNMRYATWESGITYTKGDRVSRQDAWGQSGTPKYFKSFKCIKNHLSDATVTRPGDGSDWDTYWAKVRLDNVVDEDGDVTDDWFFLPVAAQSTVGTFHGSRLWLRRDDEDDWSRVQYSAPLKPERDATIADLTFDPTDWAPDDSIDGDGGGWLAVYGQDGDAIRALQSYGNYLIIAKRWHSYVLAGTNEQTWTLRQLGDFGAVGPQAICEHEGLVYMLSSTGTLTATDGTSMK
jgi:hypothetical protein